MKKTLYTAIIGNYDRLFPVPADFRQGWELKCFTDQKHLRAEGWEISAIESNGLPDVALSKKIKALPHRYLPEAGISLWIDASYKMLGPLEEFASIFDSDDLALFEHPERSCVYEEMDAILHLKKADPVAIGRQKQEYLRLKVPRGGGLYRCGVLYRRNCAKVAIMNELWWSYTQQFGTWRDQLTLPLALAGRDLRPRVFPDEYLRRFFRQQTVHRKQKAA